VRSKRFDAGVSRNNFFGRIDVGIITAHTQRKENASEALLKIKKRSANSRTFMCK
jgi:hypothetical protein